MKAGDRITLARLRRLALRWCPPEARWDRLIESRSWGPAHEIGHALIEPQFRWSMPDYGRCGLGCCQCDRFECDIIERTAMLISARLVTYAGHPELVDNEIEYTDDYNAIDSPYFGRQARRRLVRSGLWPVPYTISRLTSALRCRTMHARQPVSRDTADRESHAA